jgi:peptidoglycan/LPS O-acetylase OafA/YrhL
MVAFFCAGLPVGGRIVAMLLTSVLVLVAALILADAYEAPFRRLLRRALDRNRLVAPKPTSD